MIALGELIPMVRDNTTQITALETWRSSTEIENVALRAEVADLTERVEFLEAA